MIEPTVPEIAASPFPAHREHDRSISRLEFMSGNSRQEGAEMTKERGFDRRAYDQFPKEINDIIYAASKAGAKEALLELSAEISRFGIKKAVYAVGAALVGLLSAVSYWFLHGGSPPK